MNLEKKIYKNKSDKLYIELFRFQKIPKLMKKLINSTTKKLIYKKDL